MIAGVKNQGRPANAGPKILLADTSRWGLAARLAIGLTNAGGSVFAVCPDRHPLQKTHAVRATFSYSGLSPLRSLVAAIKAVEPEIVIPCDDRATQHLHELYADAQRSGNSGSGIAALISRSLGEPESFPIVSSRLDLLRVAREEGLRVPDFGAIHTVDDLKSWQAKHPLPGVLKADGTWGGRGVKIAHTPERAGEFLRELTRLFATSRVIKRWLVNRDPFWVRSWWSRSRPAVMVQTYIQGRPANCAAVCWQGRLLGMIGVEVVSADGSTGPASVVRVVESPDMARCAERLARRLGLSGFFGLDFMIEEGSGNAYLIEMNPRCTPPCHVQLGAGRDLVGAFLAQLSGQPVRETTPVTNREMIAYFPQAWTSQSEFLQSSYQDVPHDEAELVQELLEPWPNRSLLFRASNWLHHVMRFETTGEASKWSGYSG